MDIPIINDALLEPDEFFTVEISTTSSNATVTVPSAVMTITDHDYQVSITNLTVNEDVGTASFVVSLDRSPEDDDVVSVSYSTINGTALAGSDYTAVVGGTVEYRGPGHASPATGSAVCYGTHIK